MTETWGSTQFLGDVLDGIRIGNQYAQLGQRADAVWDNRDGVVRDVERLQIRTESNTFWKYCQTQEGELQAFQEREHIKLVGDRLDHAVCYAKVFQTADSKERSGKGVLEEGTVCHS